MNLFKRFIFFNHATFIFWLIITTPIAWLIFFLESVFVGIKAFWDDLTINVYFPNWSKSNYLKRKKHFIK